MITLTTEQAQQIEEALVNLCNSIQLPTSDVKALATIRAARAQEQAEQEPAAKQDSDDRRLLQEIFMLCEATEELESTNDFMRGRIFEAKGIRRGIGTWYQETFCGRSYMGEPVLNAAPVQQVTRADLKAAFKEGFERAADLYAPNDGQEPYAYEVWDVQDQSFTMIYATQLKEFHWIEPENIARVLYAAPVRTKDLTDEEITNEWESMGRGLGKYTEFARAVIEKFKEKNK